MCIIYLFYYLSFSDQVQIEEESERKTVAFFSDQVQIEEESERKTVAFFS